MEQVRLFYANVAKGLFVSQNEDGPYLDFPNNNPPKLFMDQNVCIKTAKELTNNNGSITVNSIVINSNIIPRRFWEK